MAETHKNESATIDLMDRPTLCFFDFDRVQVSLQSVTDYEDFQSLSLTERQAILQKLINRVKTL